VSEIADAIHADAEAARAEIRAAGIFCPSCGVNMADLPEGHMLTNGDLTGTAAMVKSVDHGAPWPPAPEAGR
jgi:hypothetical protein